MVLIFYTSVIFLGYIFFGYPFCLWIGSLCVRKTLRKGSDQPSVSLIIAAYNEADVIGEKIKNTLALDYPKEKLDIIIVSDGSTDATDEIVRTYKASGVRLVRVEGRVGKTACQNEAMLHARGDIVVFSDANSMYDTRAIALLVSHFSDPAIGVVSGELRYTKGDERSYWSFERLLKLWESSIDSCLAANGAIYALRASLYEPLPSQAQSDFVEPFLIRRKGFRVVYEPEAFCVEEAPHAKGTIARKRRIVLRALQSLFLVKDFLNPFYFGIYALMFWSHKIFRWLMPFFLIALLVASVTLLDTLFFAQIIFMSYMLLFSLALLGTTTQKKPAAGATYFIRVQIAVFLAWLDFLVGKRIVAWNIRS